MGTGALSPNQPQSSGHIKNGWSYTSIPPYAFMLLYFKHKDKFAFTVSTRKELESYYNTWDLKVLTAVVTKAAIFWDAAPCGLYVNRRFGGTYHHKYAQPPAAIWPRARLIFCPDKVGFTFHLNVGSHATTIIKPKISYRRWTDYMRVRVFVQLSSDLRTRNSSST
jgi:hypothetical protein